MSLITNVLLVGATADDMVWINRAIYEADPQRRQQLVRLGVDAAGGTKFFTDDVYAAAFNYFTADQLVGVLDGLVEQKRIQGWRITAFANCEVVNEIGAEYGWQKVWPVSAGSDGEDR